MKPPGDTLEPVGQVAVHASALESLYRQKLAVVEVDGAPVFVPINA